MLKMKLFTASIFNVNCSLTEKFLFKEKFVKNTSLQTCIILKLSMIIFKIIVHKTSVDFEQRLIISLQ